MRERLREVPQLPLRLRVVLLGEQSHVVGEPGEPLEQLMGLVLPAHEREVVDEPERARQERALARRQPVDAALGRVALDVAVDHQLPLDRLDGAHHALVGGGQEPDERHHQHRGVELRRPVRLDERPCVSRPRPSRSTSAWISSRTATMSSSMGFRTTDASGSSSITLRGAVERHPRHHLRVGEVLARAPHLPDALVGLLPRGCAGSRGPSPRATTRRRRARARPAALVERVEDLAVDVQLELLRRGVADPHRRRVLVAGEPATSNSVSRRSPATPYMICSSLRARRPRRGAASGATRAPRRCSPRHQRVERERRVAQPAVAVVPVADAADPLGQRRGRRGDDAARGRVGERLEGDERAVDELLPLAVVRAALRPLLPPRGRPGERHAASHRAGAGVRATGTRRARTGTRRPRRP